MVVGIVFFFLLLPPSTPLPRTSILCCPFLLWDFPVLFAVLFFPAPLFLFYVSFCCISTSYSFLLVYLCDMVVNIVFSFFVFVDIVFFLTLSLLTSSCFPFSLLIFFCYCLAFVDRIFCLLYFCWYYIVVSVIFVAVDFVFPSCRSCRPLWRFSSSCSRWRLTCAPFTRFSGSGSPFARSSPFRASRSVHYHLPVSPVKYRQSFQPGGLSAVWYPWLIATAVREESRFAVRWILNFVNGFVRIAICDGQ